MHVKSNLFKSLGLLLAVMLLFAAFPAGEVKAATPVYVDDNFDSSTPGWGTTHFASIQDGINAVDSGGTVYVADGVYTAVDRALAIIDKPLTLTGESQAGTILDGGTYGAGTDITGLGDNWPRAIVVQSDSVTIENLTISNFNGNSYGIVATTETGWGVSDTSIDDLIIQDVTFEDVFVGFYAYSLLEPLFQNNTYSLVDDNAYYFIYMISTTDAVIRANNSDQGGYWVTDATNATIGGPLPADGNSLVNGKYNGIWLGQQFAAGTSSSGTIQNNTVNGAEEGGIVVWNFVGETADIKILDNTVSNTKAVSDPHGGISVYNGIFNNLVVTGNVVTDTIEVSGKPAPPGLKIISNTINGADISGNEFSNNAGEGIYLYNVTRSGDISIDNNTISGNAGAEIKMELGTATTLDAYPNWFGASTGPAAGEIVGNVKVNPWCYTADCTQLYMAAGGLIQDAIDVIAELPTPSTLTTYTIYVAEGTYNETVGIIQEENKNIVLQPELFGGVYGNVTLTGQIRIDGNGRSAGTESVTIQGFTFDLTAAGGQDAITSYDVAPAQTYVYSHNVYVKDSTFIGDAALGDVAVRAQATGGHYNYVFDNLTVTSMHSLAQMTSVSLVTVKNSTVSGGKSGVNLSGSPALIDGLTYTGTAYGVRTNGDLTLKNSSLTSSGDANNLSDPDTALVLRHDTVKTITIEDSLLQNSVVGNFSISNTTGSPAEKVTLVVTDGDTGGGSFDLSLLGGFTPIRLIHTVGDTMTINFFTTIQAAVDAAVAGDTVDVGAGTYTEQVVITKDITLVGAGDDVTTIQAFSGMPSCFRTSYDAYPIVCVMNANATIDGFTIDGLGLGASNYKFMGVAFRNAGGAVKNSTVKDIRNEPFSGAQHGVGLYLYNDDTVPRDIDILDNTFVGFQKNAMAVIGNSLTPLTVDIQRNVVTGAGATTITAQNGIQVQGELVTGLISNNTISGIYYINPVDSCDYVASSILNYYADVDITNNTITGAQEAIYPYMAAGDITGNNISITRADQCWNDAIYVYHPTASMDISNNVMTYDANSLTGYDSYGIGVSVGDDDIAITLNNNQVTDFDMGIDLYRSTSVLGDLTSISVTNNTLQTNLIDLWVEGTLQADPTIFKNKFLGDAVGVQNDLDHQVDASLNYWGSACGPASTAVVGDVIYAPWYTDAAMTVTGSGELGDFIFPTNSTTDSMNAIIACAAPGSTLTFGDPAFAYPGGLMVGADKTALEFELNGATVGAGSPAFTIYGDDITINGPGIIDGDPTDTGTKSTSPGILVAAGADNFILDGVYVEDWANGVQVQGAHDSFKVVSSWLHDNAGAGLLFDADISFTEGSVVTIHGNLFKENTGSGVENASTTVTIPASYNSWGDIGGPTAGDGVSSFVTTAPFTYSEVFVDMVPDLLSTSVGINEQSEFDVAVKVDSVNLYAISYELTYDTNFLELQSVVDGSFKGTGACTTDYTTTPGVISVFCTRFTPDPEVNNPDGETISTITFKATGSGLAGNGPWTTYLDLSVDESDLSSGAVGGVKVFVNNGDFGAPSTEDGHTITDSDDGEVNITGLANFTGYIDLQGRANDSGATLTVFDQQTISGAMALVDATSASSGKYTTDSTILTIGTDYYFQVDAPLFLPTTAIAATSFANSDVLDTRSLTTLLTFTLLGGDANNDDYIQIQDLSCIGGSYNLTPGVCGVDGSADVNADGVVDIYDLVLAGGNYEKGSSPWVQQQ